MKKCAWIACGVLLGGMSVAAPPPISAFARLEQVRSPTLSPDGKYLLYITQVNANRIAAVTDLKAAEPKITPVLTLEKEKDAELSWCRWANNTRVICGVQVPETIMTRVIRTSRLVAVNADGSDPKMLRQNTPSAFSLNQDEVVDITPGDPDTILVQSYEAPGGRLTADSYPAVFELNIYTGKLKKQTREYPPIRTFFSDGHGNVRLGVGLKGTTYIYFARLDGDKEWRQLSRVEAFEMTNSYVPQSIVPGTNKAYAYGPSGDRRALYKIDLEDKAKPELIFEHPQVDVGNPIRANDGRLLGVFYETDRPFIYYTDDRIAALMQAVKKAFPTNFNVPYSATNDAKTVVIGSNSDVEAGAFYMLDMTTGKSSRIGRAYPELDPEQLPRMRSIEYQAKDGTMIPGYLTAPLNAREEKLPLIVMPHGGPRARDSWRFDFLRHFLASRGYAVLQMNFRGSTGYGGKWFDAAFQDWGGLTYSDIADGARWAIDKGIADPKRICIVGWSFGGYAALVGATRNSDLFKCSVSIAGLSDLVALRSSAFGAINAQVVQKQIGNDKAKLRENSPIEHVANTNMPVLLVHGTMDAQSPYSQSKQMAEELKSKNKNFKFVTIENADHGLTRESERTTLLTEIEQFLTTNLGPGTVAN